MVETDGYSSTTLGDGERRSCYDTTVNMIFLWAEPERKISANVVAATDVRILFLAIVANL